MVRIVVGNKELKKAARDYSTKVALQNKHVHLDYYMLKYLIQQAYISGYYHDITSFSSRQIDNEWRRYNF